MTGFVALNIALLVSSDIDALCRRMNTALCAAPFSDFRKPSNYPHITLAMSVFREKEIPAIVKEVTPLKPYLPVGFSITELYHKTSEQIGQEYQLLVEKDEDFDEFHREFMERIRPYFTSVPTTREMIDVDADELWESHTAYWVDGFRNKRPDSYKPHISLKCRHASLDAILPNAMLPLKGTAERMVIAHVGNYCSCRKIVKEI